MIRAYFNQRAAIWDETVAEKDTTKLERMAERLNIRPGSTPDGDEMRLMLPAAGFSQIKIDDDSDSYLASGRKSQMEVA